MSYLQKYLDNKQTKGLWLAFATPEISLSHFPSSTDATKAWQVHSYVPGSYYTVMLYNYNHHAGHKFFRVNYNIYS